MDEIKKDKTITTEDLLIKIKEKFKDIELSRRHITNIIRDTNNSLKLTRFRQNGYQTFLIDEFRTNCRCYKCEGGLCEKYIIRENPKPFKNLRLVHGAIRCKTCLVRWNRDCNGATNIYKIAKNAINKKLRPNYLTRGNTSNVLNDTLKT